MQSQQRKAPTLEIAQRPKEPPSTGKDVEIETNFRRVKFDYPKIYSYTFEVTTQGNKASKDDIYKVFHKLCEDKSFGSDTFPVNDENMVFSSIRIDDHKNLEVKVDEKEYIINLKFSSDIDFIKLKEYIEQDSCKILDSELLNLLRVLNIYLNYGVRSKNLTLGRRTFPIPDKPLYINGGLELMRGLYQSIRIGFDQLLVNIDVCATTYYPSGKLTDLLPKILYEVNLHKGLYDEDIQYLKRFLKNLKFTTNDSKTEKKISDITFRSANKHIFYMEGVSITVSKYYKDTKKQNLVYPNLPCIVVKEGNRKEYLPLELCVLVRGQKHNTEYLEPYQQEDMIKKTIIEPKERFAKIDEGIRKEYKHVDDKGLKSISFDVDDKFVKLKSKILDSPEIIVNNKRISTEKGSWDAIKFNESANLYNWSVVCFDFKLKEPEIKSSMRTLKEILISKGLNVPHMPKISRHNYHDYKTAIQMAKQDSIIDRSKPAQLIICIIPKKLQDENCLYAKIKRICYLELGIMCQCILTKNIKDKRRLNQVFHNISLKINGKLNGKNSRLADGLLHLKEEKAHMVFAADVYHPGKADKKKGRPSVAAVCGSMDDTATDYSCRYHMNEKLRHDVDIIENLNEMVIELLDQRENKGNILPDQIVFYRDGVGETQFETVITDELEPLLGALEKHYESKNLPAPKLTFIIIQKRHHARFKLLNGDNCKHGTIVDTEIVMRKEFSFYLQSHVSPRGTARSAYYHVLLNQGNFSADEIYNLTFRLCFLSYRCNSALSQVAPASYAHNIANLGRYFVEYKPIKPIFRKSGKQKDGNNSGPTLPDKVQGGKTNFANENIKNEKFFL